ncbi:NAD(P)/FAD-dependent oxidoreductase [Candidatus Halocynthiibacter alkanivorans]|uniref:NAD(P)/FAD-dependent oxidoreductase n=1 Tax=Candidatus Halocynthiibacter alkanivorans TaxID=2267619 RepID=UPI000DF3867D|nr:FAD-dependent oxidoreductase [Candidatus Halocynthiibacter alkanivorans]
MQRIYETEAYSPASDQGNYWLSTVTDSRAPYPQLSGSRRVEVAIVGGGYTGLSAALHLTEAGTEALVLEAQTIGYGASGRNGGFAMIGGAKASDSSLIRSYGLEGLRDFHRGQRASVDLVADLLARLNIDADTHSKGELCLAHRPKDMATLRAESQHQEALFGLDAEIIEPGDLAARGMASPGFHGGMIYPLGFALNPRKYVLGLAHAALDAGAEICANSAVQSISRNPDGSYLLRCETGEVVARKLILATNGYSSDDLPGWMKARYLPVQSNVLVSRELTDGEISAQGWSTDLMAFDTRNLLHYFRLMPNRRFLFGMRGGIKATPGAKAEMHRRIRRDFETMFPAWSEVETPYFWSGLACLSRNLTPYVGPLKSWPGAYTGIAYHGNGVAMASYAGALLADLVLNRNARPYPEIMKAPLKRFPFGAWRRNLLRPAYRWYGLVDGA